MEQMMPKAASFSMVRPVDLHVDRQYQRPLNTEHVNTIIRTFDRLSFGAVVVNRRDNGDLYVLDGQHRIEAMKRMGNGTTPVMAVMHEGLSVGEEADIYYMQSKAKPINPVDLFRARLFAGETVALAMQNILDRYGLKVGTKQNADTIQAPNTIEHIFTQHGRDRLDRVIRLTTSVWSDERKSIPGYLFGGMNAFLSRYEKQLDENRLVEVLSATPKAEIEEAARALSKFTHDNSHVRYGRAFLHFYNRRLQRKLDDWDARSRELHAEQITEAGKPNRFKKAS